MEMKKLVLLRFGSSSVIAVVVVVVIVCFPIAIVVVAAVVGIIVSILVGIFVFQCWKKEIKENRLAQLIQYYEVS